MNILLFENVADGIINIPEGQLKLLRINKQDLCITRIGTHFKVFNDMCPHLGARLHQGNLNKFNEVVCPLHDYRFDLKLGTEALGRCHALKMYRVVSEKNGVFLTDSEVLDD